MHRRSVAVAFGRARPLAGDLPTDGPSVCLLYESEEERDELSHRLRKAGLDELPWQFVDLGSDKGLRPLLGAVRNSPRHLMDMLGAGSAATCAVLTSHWPLIAAVMLWIAPLLVMLRLIRGSSPSKVTASG